MTEIDIIIPVYNERLEVVKETVAAIHQSFESRGNYNVIVVDDGSKAEYKLASLKDFPGITFVQHPQNRGYGSSLKTGILTGSAPWVAITDADGTYPVADLPKLAELMEGQDMVIGIRTGKICKIPTLRRFPKKVLNLLASYMAGAQIKDLNSGMRIFHRDLSYYLWNFFPTGFSFTSTITMGAILGGFRVKELPINYFRRDGKSSIAPIADTIRFTRLICRLGLIFCPMKVFGPISLLLFAIGAAKGFGIDYPADGHVGNLSVMSMLAAVQIFMMGLIGKLIVHGRYLPLTPAQHNPLQVKLADEKPQLKAVSSS